MGYEWTAMSYQEKLVGSQAISIFALAVLLVYMVLAGQYESWLLPIAVILVVPLALLGTVAAVALRGMDVNILHADRYCADHRPGEQERDPDRRVCARSAAARSWDRRGRHEIRSAAVRPILMTSFAFILGIVPLVGARGAGAASRQRSARPSSVA